MNGQDRLDEARERAYAAMRHEKSCTCGECSGGLNAIDTLYESAVRLREILMPPDESRPQSASVVRVTGRSDIDTVRDALRQHGGGLGKRYLHGDALAALSRIQHALECAEMIPARQHPTDGPYLYLPAGDADALADALAAVRGEADE